MHKLRYLPLAQKDLRDIISYIADTLKAPKAAMDLVDALDHSISRLVQFPYSCKVYQPIEPLALAEGIKLEHKGLSDFTPSMYQQIIGDKSHLERMAFLLFPHGLK